MIAMQTAARLPAQTCLLVRLVQLAQHRIEDQLAGRDQLVDQQLAQVGCFTGPGVGDRGAEQIHVPVAVEVAGHHGEGIAVAAKRLLGRAPLAAPLDEEGLHPLGILAVADQVTVDPQSVGDVLVTRGLGGSRPDGIPLPAIGRADQLRITVAVEVGRRQAVKRPMRAQASRRLLREQTPGLGHVAELACGQAAIDPHRLGREALAVMVVGVAEDQVEPSVAVEIGQHRAMGGAMTGQRQPIFGQPLEAPAAAPEVDLVGLRVLLVLLRVLCRDADRVEHPVAIQIAPDDEAVLSLRRAEAGALRDFDEGPTTELAGHGAIDPVDPGSVGARPADAEVEPAVAVDVDQLPASGRRVRQAGPLAGIGQSVGKQSRRRQQQQRQRQPAHQTQRTE